MYRSAGLLLVCLLGVSSARAQSTTPIAVETNVPGVTAISGVNSDPTQRQDSIGLYGKGGVGLVVSGIRLGASITGEIGTGANVTGRTLGLSGVCGAAACTGLRGSGTNELGVGVMGIGMYGVIGQSVQPAPFLQSYHSWAGYFIGDVHVDGTIDAPIIQQQQATITSLQGQVAALTAQFAALASAAGFHGIIPHAIPSRIEAEAYDAGGQGIGYFDSTPGNEQGFAVYRNDDVDIKTSQDGGYSIGWMTHGEWLAYTVTVPSDGLYRFDVRLGSALPGRTFHLEVDGINRSGSIPVPQVSDWDQFETFENITMPLTAGQRIIKFVVDGEDWLDFQWFEIRSQTTP